MIFNLGPHQEVYSNISEETDFQRKKSLFHHPEDSILSNNLDGKF